MNKRESTPHEIKLYEALIKRNIDATLGYYDQHKTVDIAVLPARMYIEVDDLRHFTDPVQIERDFKRSHFSDGDDFCTFYVTNQIIDNYVEKVADALAEVIKKRIKK